jgi:hypothetical protein
VPTTELARVPSKHWGKFVQKLGQIPHFPPIFGRDGTRDTLHVSKTFSKKLSLRERQRDKRQQQHLVDLSKIVVMTVNES